LDKKVRKEFISNRQQEGLAFFQQTKTYFELTGEDDVLLGTKTFFGTKLIVY
jgi:hypothetical protein